MSSCIGTNQIKFNEENGHQSDGRGEGGKNPLIPKRSWNNEFKIYS